MPTKLKRLQFFCTEQEQQRILHLAENAGLSVSRFLHAVFMETHIPTREDTLLRHELRQVNADMARLGGLLKIALSNSQGSPDEIRELMEGLSALKDILREKIRSI